MKWTIPKDQIHFVLRNVADNMKEKQTRCSYVKKNSLVFDQYSVSADTKRPDIEMSIGTENMLLEHLYGED